MKKGLLLLACTLLILIGRKDDIFAQSVQLDDKNIEVVQILDWSDDVKNGIMQEGGLLRADDYVFSDKVFVVQEDMWEVQEALLEAMESRQSQVDLREFHIQAQNFVGIFSKLMNSHPELFYVNAFESLPYYEVASGYMTDLYLKYYWDKDESEKKIAEYESAIDLAMRNVNRNWSDVEKALYINDYLCENITYDNTYSYYDAYHGLVEGTTVCQGYALAYLAIAQRMGLETQMVTSDSLDHAWNMVKINDRYYHVDSTWNDNVYEEGLSSHYYFLKSTSSFMHDSIGMDTGHSAYDYVIQGNWSPDFAVYTEYDNNSVWENIHSTFNYLNGEWYTYDDDNGYILDYRYTTEGFKLVDKKALPSYLTPSGREVHFSSVGEYNGKLYYSQGREGIYEWNIKSDATSLIYPYPEELKANKGYMIYMEIDAYGRISFWYYDGSKVCYKSNVDCLDNSIYKITYKLDGGEMGQSLPTTYMTQNETFSLGKPKKAGYTFMGWYTDKNFTNKIMYIAKGTYGNQTLYAKWAKNYKITYVLNGGINHGANPIRYCKYTATIQLEKPIRLGYKFLGWYTNKNYTGKITKIKTGSIGNKTLYAKWKKIRR